MRVENPVYDRERAEQVWAAIYTENLERAEELARADLARWWDIDHPRTEEAAAVVQVDRRGHAVFSEEHAEASQEAGSEVPDAMQDGWAINLPRVVDYSGWPRLYSASWASKTTIEDTPTGFTLEAGFRAANAVLCDAGRRHVYTESMLETLPHEVGHLLSTIYHDRVPETYGDRVIVEFFGAIADQVYRETMDYTGDERAPYTQNPFTDAEELDETRLRQGHPVGEQLAYRALDQGDDPAELVRMANADLLDRYDDEIQDIHAQYPVAPDLDDPDLLVQAQSGDHD